MSQSLAPQTSSSQVVQPQPPLSARNSSSTVGQHPPPVSRKPTFQQITLVDSTSGQPEIQNPEDLQHDPDAATDSPSLARRWTSQSLHDRRTSRKFRNYRENRFIGPKDPDASAGEEPLDVPQSGRYERGKKRVRGLLGARKQMQLALEEDAVIDVLYENQRGWWVFGVPHFSSKTLLNFDPKPWLNGHKKPSPVNITNAQVPDPSWEWAWKSWYVDMSRDVDEEGWEYSFWFSEGTSWHGTHPWAHSWVRRRRWLRKRVRKQPQKGLTQLGHNFTSEYFTIHPPKASSKTNSRASSVVLDNVVAKNSRRLEDYIPDPADVRDIGTLLASLKRAAIDREKIVLVRHFIDNGGEDLYYLGEHMETIMSLCIFQNSRRYILSMLSEKLSLAQSSANDHEAHDEEITHQHSTKIQSLEHAVKMADAQVKKLEYWSDVKSMAREGNTAGANDEDHGWDSFAWRGLDSSGPEADVGTTSKEKGKTWKQVKKEVDTQLDPRDSGVIVGADGKKKGKEADGQATDSTYQTAQENIGRDKGKGRAE